MAMVVKELKKKMKLPSLSLPQAVLRFFNRPLPSDSWGDFYPRRRFSQDELKKIKKIRVKGSGIAKGIIGIPNVFTIKLNGLEFTHLSIDVEGPCRSKVRRHDPEDGNMKSVKLSYKVFTPGNYTFDIRYRGFPVTGSPFVTKVEEYWPTFVPILNPRAVVAAGKGLSVSHTDEVATLRLDTSAAGKGRLAARMYFEDDQLDRLKEDLLQLIQYVQVDDGWLIEYVNKREGPYLLEVKYGGENIPGSPFSCHCYGTANSHCSTGTGAMLTSFFKKRNLIEEEERRERWAFLEN